MSVNIYIKKEDKKFTLYGVNDVYSLKNKTRDTLDDISDQIRDAASHFAPISDPDDKAGGSARHIPSGTLKKNPVDISHSREGEAGAVGRFGFRFRAPAGSPGGIGGQFVSSRSRATIEGHIFFEIVISYPEHPFYAKFVSFGVRGHGPKGPKPMKFRYKGANYKTDYVSGQEAQPYLTEAVESVQGYVQMKLSELKAEAKLIRSGG